MSQKTDLQLNTRWVDPELSRIVAAWPPDAWPVRLFRGDEPVTFDTPAALKAATLADDQEQLVMEPMELFA